LIKKYLIYLFLISVNSLVFAVDRCPDTGVWLQVLGSGGPEIDDGRASSGYLVWKNGKARILVDMGGGSLLRFEQSGAQLNDLDVILLSHLHVDHSADLPYLLKASYFTGRHRDLYIYGPTGNGLMPAMTEFVQNLFGPRGAYRYLSGYLDGQDLYKLVPVDIAAKGKAYQSVLHTPDYRLSTVPVHHGPVPALAWRVDIAGYIIVFSGDMNNDNNTLMQLAKNADLLVAHHAIPEHAGRVARNLHMPPSVIGKIAHQASVKGLILSHRMKRTLGREVETKNIIANNFHGMIVFADDLQCFKLSR